jgi:solute carrier family 25 phosphate transporter 3
VPSTLDSVQSFSSSALHAPFTDSRTEAKISRVPYTITKFVAFEKIAETIFGMFDKASMSSGAQTTVNLGSGLLAGFAAAIVSQPADTMLSKINKTKGLPGESTVSRLIKIAGELGLRGSFAGLPTRLFMVGGLTAGQFAIYGEIKKALGKSDTLHASCSQHVLTSLAGASAGVEIAK